jgi:hypothetical protein
MDYGTLAATAVGAVIGVGATLISDSVQARRDIDQKWLDTKRLVYVRLLEALAQAHSRITVAAFQGLCGTERRYAVHHAFHDDPRHSEAKSVLRELAITAPENVYRLASDVYQSLRVVRDILAEPSTIADNPEFRRANDSFFKNLENLQQLMRIDLKPAIRRHGILGKRRQDVVTNEFDPDSQLDEGSA